MIRTAALAFDEDGGLFVVEMNDYPDGDTMLPDALERLTGAEAMGTLFKVAAAVSPGLPVPPGFEPPGFEPPGFGPPGSGASAGEG